MRSVIHEDIKNKSTLLVTIGDSWTWGDSIDNISSSGTLDSPKRLVSIYGYHLQNLLGDCDWINLGYPGTGNRWIIDCALRFDLIQPMTNYKNIILSVGLTDIGRDTYPRYDTRLGISFQQFAEKTEQEFLTKLKTLENNPNITLLVSRNFTSTFEKNKSVIKNHLPNKWIDISKNNWDPVYNLAECFTLNYPDTLSTIEKEWAIAVGIPTSQSVIDFLIKCPLHYNTGSKHPTEEGHKFWAEYLHDYICHL